MAFQEEKQSTDLHRISRKITRCKHRQFTAFRKIVAVLGLITWKISTIPSRKSIPVRLLRSLAGFVCIAVTGVGIWIVYLYHTRIRRMTRSRDKIRKKTEAGGEKMPDQGDPSCGDYSAQGKDGPCVREPAVNVYGVAYM